MKPGDLILPDAAGRTVTYAIGDVHGRRDLLDTLLTRIQTDAEARNAAARIVFTGDYCDRGADSRGVIDRLIQGPAREGDSFVCLLGNHDDLFVKAVTTGDDVPTWAWFLLDHTLLSYGPAGDPDMTSVEQHVEFLSSLPLTYDDGTYLFVHAGIRPGVPLAEQEREDLLWIREEFLTYDGALPRRVVHGHTIMGTEPVFRDNRISIDTGAFRTGVLTAAVLDGADVTYLQAEGAPDEGAIAREAYLHLSNQRGFDPLPDERPVRQR